MEDAVGESGAITWTSDTNWIVTRGSPEALIAVESSDFSKSDLESTVAKSPLVLKPRSPDSGPCEIQIHFDQKFDIGQIYVRSTARVYEIYYARSPRSGNEYLCTVRCGAAERDGNVLQTACIEHVEGHGSCASEELTIESNTKCGSHSSGEDDWVKVKIPEVQRRSLSDKTSSDQAESIQAWDLYEATAQVSDVEPCSSLTIRLLSLQDKGNLYIDEIYIFVDPAESSDSGNERALAGTLGQNSLMAMFVPTLLQLSKSGVSRVQDKHTSDVVLKDETEAGSESTDQSDVRLQSNQVQLQYAELKRLNDKNTPESIEPQQPTMANKCSEPVNSYPFPSGNLENTLEKLVSRVSRVEDIFLRFEEKMLGPISSIETRLQRVELQLEKLAQSSLGSGMPHGTRISAPAFSCSESNSSSVYDDQSDYPTGGGTSEIENKDLSCDSTPELPQSCDAKFQPSLVVSAPTFTDGKDGEDENDVTPLEDSSCIKLEQRKALSVDDALAIALNGFLSTAIDLPSGNIQTTSGLSSKVDEESQFELHGIEGQESPVAENTDTESLQYTQVLIFKAPDFSADEIGNEDDLKYAQSDSNMVSVLKNGVTGYDDEIGSPVDFHKNESAPDFESKNGRSFDDSIEVIRTYFSNGGFNESPEVNTMDSSVDGNHSCTPTVTSNASQSDLAKVSVKSNRPQIDDETNPGNQHDSENVSVVPEINVTTLEECLQDADADADAEPEASHSSSSSLLDFNFPILDVKFTPDVSSNPQSLLEGLLFGSAGSSIELPSVHDRTDGSDGDAPMMVVSNETRDFLPVSQAVLVDVGVPNGADEAPDIGGLPGACKRSCPGTEVSLI